MRFPRLMPTLILVALGAGAVSLGCSSNDKNPVNPGPGAGSNTPFDSGLKTTPSADYVRSFPQLGVVNYYCIPHAPGMVGSVTVEATGLDTAFVTVANMTFTPQDVTIRQHGVVVWRWASGTHTVTSGVPVVAATRGHAGRH